VERVAALLARFCFIEEQLQCGAHWPMHEASARALSAIGNLHNNCSGKHTFMLAASAARGWDLDYRPPHHPLQAMIRDTLDTVSNVSHGVGVDGCSVPTFHAPLSAQARAWTVLAEAMAGTAGDARGDLNGRLSAVGWAMHRNPFWMSGDGRLDKGIVEGASEPLTGKVGAEGLFCIARPNARQGIAVKVHSGSTEALGPALRVVMGELGVGFDGPLSGERVKNVRGVVVGERAGRLG
jgi:L-asparaginase II